MTSSPTIEVVIDAHGSVRLQTTGFAGPACRRASADLEAALGVVQADQPTAEFYQAQAISQPQQLRQKS
jgi:hypothetical protein